MRPGRQLSEYMPLLLVYGIIMAIVTPQFQKKGVGTASALAAGFGAATALFALWFLFVALQNWRDRRRGSQVAMQVPFVESVSASVVRIACASGAVGKLLRSLGAKRLLFSPSSWELRYSSEQGLALCLGRLRDAGVAMAGAQAGWPPAAVFEDLREKGKISGQFTQIIWSGPGQWDLSKK